MSLHLLVVLSIKYEDAYNASGNIKMISCVIADAISVSDGESAHIARYSSNRKLLDWGHW